MSSPVHDDRDKRVMYAPPWAREKPQQPPQAIVAAIDRLRQERLRVTTPPEGRTEDPPLNNDDPHDPLFAERPDMAEAERDGALRAPWRASSLEPVVMPEPPKPEFGAPGWGVFLRLSGAVGVAAAVALFVTGAVPLPSIDISLSPDEATNVASAAPTADGAIEPKHPAVVAAASPSVLPAAVSAAHASAPAAVPDAPAAKPAPSAVLPSEVLTAFAAADAASASAALPRRGPMVASAPAPAAAVAPAAPKLRTIAPDELEGLIKRGEALLSQGDISSARLLLQRAAEAGDAPAALMLAGTYDAAELARMNVIGVAPDHAKAKHWYTKAIERGSAEAVGRLQQLAERAN